ncbi:uncharacterized protein MYCFIDRAFT_175105 [Pseudocercospora fijiensis CIRAD86]|uniref:Uncharacterized protein n=1 Tax=Pseudocercospora fijiensis (strain CIRAD86) TaxID=383855 RepID=M3AGH8_PSEFD|nr:uncharacterized protein MYCFIDRAFT_175105 [Pseudocercospora fijiensis CIRAD86]EME83681.1 hypothetical protein MYCFIDRAFT_175105 [Pseudocercospora fijiensis CIRAD86]
MTLPPLQPQLPTPPILANLLLNTENRKPIQNLLNPIKKPPNPHHHPHRAGDFFPIRFRNIDKFWDGKILRVWLVGRQSPEEWFEDLQDWRQGSMGRRDWRGRGVVSFMVDGRIGWDIGSLWGG